MKSQMKKFKKTFEQSKNLVAQAAQDSWNVTKEKSIEGASFAQTQIEKLGQYLKSEAYEQDLDQVIELLYIHKASSKPSFSKFASRNERVFQKSKFIKEQAILFVAATAGIGAEIGGQLMGPQGLATGFAIGTAAGVIIVTVVAGHIIIKRLNSGFTPSSLMPV